MIDLSQLLETQRRMLEHNDYADQLRQQAQQFWNAQDEMLDDMRSFFDGWCERRHAGTRAALDATCVLTEAKDMETVNEALRNWSEGAMQRLMQDASEQMSCLAQLGSRMANGNGIQIPIAGEEDAATPKAANESKPAGAGSRRKAA